jgi:hypothetical protein
MELRTHDSQVGHVKSIPFPNVSKAKSHNTPLPPQSFPFIRQPAPATPSETPPTSRNFFLNLTPATILQQTSTTRPPSVSRESWSPYPPHHQLAPYTKKGKQTLTNLPVLRIQRAWPGILAICVGGVSAWAAFLAYAANQERVSSSAMRRVLGELRESDDVRAVLGDAVRPEPKWYLNGSPWVYGSVRVTFLALPLIRVPAAGQRTDPIIFVSVRSRCYRGTSTSAFASKVTTVRPLETLPRALSLVANLIRPAM